MGVLSFLPESIFGIINYFIITSRPYHFSVNQPSPSFHTRVRRRPLRRGFDSETELEIVKRLENAN